MTGLILCPNCDGRHLYLETIVPACRYEGEVRGLIQRFKYGGDIALARPLGRLLLRALRDPRIAGRDTRCLCGGPQKEAAAAEIAAVVVARG